MDHDIKKGGMTRMDRVNLDKYDMLRRTGHTSKGDQRKWNVDDVWYKADYMGYEGLAEVIVSHLLNRGHLRYPVVYYEPAEIEYHGEVLKGCRSRNFLTEDQNLVPIEKLYRRYTGESLAMRLTDFAEAEQKIRFLVDEIIQITGIHDFGEYITEMMEIDAFFLNEDRHTNNIAVIYNEKTEEYSLSPVFDHGLCLLADVCQDYPITRPLAVCMEKVTAKPFDRDFDVQLEAAEMLYGKQVEFAFGMKEIEEELERIRDWYPKEINDRVESILRGQIRKYVYLMKIRLYLKNMIGR